VAGERRTRSIIVVAAVAVLLAALLALQACPDESVPDTGDTEETAAGETSEVDATTDEQAESDEITEEDTGVELHESQVAVAGNEIAVVTTDKGVIKFEFYPEDAPNHVASFIELAEAGFYDGIKFHRVEPNFVIQGGDPLSKTDDAMVGTGGPGYYLKAEFNSRPHIDGTVAMARSQDPDSAGSQFYITMGPQAFLDGNYTVFGQVVEGLDVVYQIQVGDVMHSVAIERGE
jgi:peptidyl-prolyl cis-trans isomerase B (cyclophilin B)